MKQYDRYVTVSAATTGKFYLGGKRVKIITCTNSPLNQRTAYYDSMESPTVLRIFAYMNTHKHVFKWSANCGIVTLQYKIYGD